MVPEIAAPRLGKETVATGPVFLKEEAARTGVAGAKAMRAASRAARGLGFLISPYDRKCRATAGRPNGPGRARLWPHSGGVTKRQGTLSDRGVLLPLEGAADDA